MTQKGPEMKSMTRNSLSVLAKTSTVTLSAVVLSAGLASANQSPSRIQILGSADVTAYSRMNEAAATKLGSDLTASFEALERASITFQSQGCNISQRDEQVAVEGPGMDGGVSAVEDGQSSATQPSLCALAIQSIDQAFGELLATLKTNVPELTSEAKKVATSVREKWDQRMRSMSLGEMQDYILNRGQSAEDKVSDRERLNDQNGKGIIGQINQLSSILRQTTGRSGNLDHVEMTMNTLEKVEGIYEALQELETTVIDAEFAYQEGKKFSALQNDFMSTALDFDQMNTISLVIRGKEINSELTGPLPIQADEVSGFNTPSSGEPQTRSRNKRW